MNDHRLECTESTAFIRQVLQRIATGPTMSKDLSAEDAKQAMRLVLEQKIDPVQSALFLIALRMKRETDAEMQGVTDAIVQGTEPLPVDRDLLVTLVDPYDGYIRSLPASPFVPAVLAACGVSVVCHGIESTGPKYGLSIHRILKAAGIDVTCSLQAAATKLSGPSANWCYVDQQVIAPELALLQRLRDQMVKRPCITTIEKGLMPLIAKRNHLVTGYVHKAYPEVYASLAKQTGFDTAAFVKGIEGGVVPSVAQPSRYFHWSGDSLVKTRITPDEINISQAARAVALPDHVLQMDDCGRPSEESIHKLAQATIEQGVAALSGTENLMYDCIVYGACVALASVRKSGIDEVIGEVRSVLRSRLALGLFQQASVV